jgi:hypothetical protein
MDPVQLTQLTAGINQSNERGGSEPGGPSFCEEKEAATSCPQVPGERTAHSRGEAAEGR